jgi:isoquinoline 1-oxidoreductase subunit alpha
MKLSINAQTVDVPAPWQDENLLKFLREHLGLVGSKFGCGMGLCGTCTVLVDNRPTRACSAPVGALEGRSIQTIEGIASRADRFHPVQQAWIDEAVIQCGYCQAGQIMTAVGLLAQAPNPTDAQIDDAFSGNLCRCGTHQRIRVAVKKAAELIKTNQSGTKT